MRLQRSGTLPTTAVEPQVRLTEVSNNRSQPAVFSRDVTGTHKKSRKVML